MNDPETGWLIRTAVPSYWYVRMKLMEIGRAL